MDILELRKHKVVEFLGIRLSYEQDIDLTLILASEDTPEAQAAEICDYFDTESRGFRNDISNLLKS
jgi:hypothetical protein